MISSIEIGDKVRFRLADSQRDFAGEIVEIETIRDEILAAFGHAAVRRFTIRDDRTGRVHRVYGDKVTKILTGSPDQHSPATTSAAEGDVTVTVTRHSVCALPADHPDAYHATIHVELAGDGRWAVRLTRDMCLSGLLTWDVDRAPDEGRAEWLDDHRFVLPVALHLAKDEARTLAARFTRP